MIISKLRKFKDYFGHLFGWGGWEGEHFVLVTWDSIQGIYYGPNVLDTKTNK
jgi:hypothetical protein